MSGIAVVIPCFELGATLLEAVDSVLEQTWGAAEIAIVDDGSRDPLTRQVLDRLIRPRTRVLREPHRGVAAARNRGAEATSSPLLVFLDADDRLEPRYLERTASRLLAGPALGFVTTALRAFEGAHYTWTPPPATAVETLARGGPHVASLMRRTMFEAVGGFAPELDGFEDTDFFLSAIERGFTGAVIDEPLLAYRVRPGSRYRAALRHDAWMATSAALRARHRTTVEGAWSELLASKERFLLEQRAHRLDLERRKGDAERRLDELRRECRALREQLPAGGRGALDASAGDPVEPVSPLWGRERGRPIDRVYIEEFLAEHESDVHGRVLEVKDDGYTRRFGGARVSEVDVLDIDPGNPRADRIVDLSRAEALPAGRYDCIVLTQVLGLVLDPDRALGHLYRALAPGGVLLLSAPSITRVSHEDRGPEGDLWRFTSASLRELLLRHFPPALVEVRARGNLRAARAFLAGLAAEDLEPAVFGQEDARFPLTLLARAEKPRAGIEGVPPRLVILCFHRVEGRALGLKLDAIRARFPVVPLGAALRPTAAGVVLTFDDGTIDHLSVASPLLGERGLPATFFVTTADLDVPHEHWWDELERAGRPPDPLCYAASLAERRRRLAELGPRPAPRGDRRVLLGAELVELARRPGHELGAHGEHHLALPLQPDEVREAEIHAPRRRLGELVGQPPGFLAWPYGEFTAACAGLARRAGYRGAVAVVPGAAAAGMDPFALPRLEADGLEPGPLVGRIEALLS